MAVEVLVGIVEVEVDGADFVLRLGAVGVVCVGVVAYGAARVLACVHKVYFEVANLALSGYGAVVFAVDGVVGGACSQDYERQPEQERF